jgi:hypothetical protein
LSEIGKGQLEPKELDQTATVHDQDQQDCKPSQGIEELQFSQAIVHDSRIQQIANFQD